ncbi:MAG: hypothetical protein IT462_15550 [Planctomycetes bacterium]|nr:hypothetical protein [Planctomycetota bacterium]
MVKLQWKLLPLGAAAVLLFLATGPITGEAEEGRAVARLKSASKNPEALSLKLYEWGVDRANWDGTAVSPNDVPDFYYSADEVTLAPAPEKPEPKPVAKPRPESGVGCAKPVVYFESDKDGVFDFEVRFAHGAIEWMYPKPSRRIDTATAQWDGIKIVSNVDDAAKLPKVRDVKADHWAAFSRDGAKSLLQVNGETEHFLFYEGSKTDLVDADVAQDADGNVVIRNFGAFAIHDVRLRLQTKDGWRAWFVREIAAANGSTPTAVTLAEGNRVELADVRKPGVLAAESKAAGLTDTQAAVFERCWRNDFVMGDRSVLTWRHDAQAVDSAVPLKAGNAKLESKRVCYAWIANIDLSRQAEFDKLADGVSTGDTAAGEKLAKSGVAGAGAVRRLISNSEVSLARRMKLAKWLKTQSGK